MSNPISDEQKKYIDQIVLKAKAAHPLMRILDATKKNQILQEAAQLLDKERNFIKQENKKDLDQAKAKGLTAAMIDRLRLTDKSIDAMIQGLHDVIVLPDPVGETSAFKVLPNGIRLGQVNVPLGVVAVIFESRPNVTIDVAALCIKSGNVSILRGGSEAIYSNKALFVLLSRAFHLVGFDQELVFLVEDTQRELVPYLLQQDKFIDVVVPRGGNALIQTVTEHSRIPVIKHDAGICHIFVAFDADKNMAESIAINAKVQRPGVCNAMETLLIDVHYPYKKELLLALADKGVKIKGCARTQEIFPNAEKASESDYATEWLDLILSVKVVNDLDEAIQHIERYSSGHSEAIISNDYKMISEFTSRLDSAALFVNCSTRFHDGGEFGLGAEVGISTQKLHVRGPMGLKHLVTQKYLVFGSGQIRG